MSIRTVLLAIVIMALAAAAARADFADQTVIGVSTGGTPVAFHVTIAFTATGGDFINGSGTATTQFTIENTSGVSPWQSPPSGNPELTDFLFNLPPGAAARLVEARALAGGTVWSSGVTIAGEHISAGCDPLTSDRLVTAWFSGGNGAAGRFGIFSNAIETDAGTRGALIDPAALANCAPRGLLHTPLAIAGPVTFTIALTGLTTALRSAEGFFALCSVPPGAGSACSMGARFLGCGTRGTGSAFAGQVCSATVVRATTWGQLKILYRR